MYFFCSVSINDREWMLLKIPEFQLSVYFYELCIIKRFVRSSDFLWLCIVVLPSHCFSSLGSVQPWEDTTPVFPLGDDLLLVRVQLPNRKNIIQASRLSNVFKCTDLDLLTVPNDHFSHSHPGAGKTDPRPALLKTPWDDRGCEPSDETNQYIYCK